MDQCVKNRLTLSYKSPLSLIEPVKKAVGPRKAESQMAEEKKAEKFWAENRVF
jgi:hypothetical protein